MACARQRISTLCSCVANIFSIFQDIALVDGTCPCLLRQAGTIGYSNHHENHINYRVVQVLEGSCRLSRGSGTRSKSRVRAAQYAGWSMLHQFIADMAAQWIIAYKAEAC